MKVAIVYPLTFGDDGVIGGGERYTRELAHAMATHVDTRLILFGAARKRYKNGPLAIEVFPRVRLIKGRPNNPANPQFLRALVDVDVIHCIGWSVLYADLAVLFARLTGKRVFVTDVGGGADFTLSKRLPIGRLVHRFLFLTKYHASLFPRFHDRASVIYGGADLVKYSPGDPVRDRKVLYVGRIIPAKGIEYLIEALHPLVPLTIIGRPYDGEYYAGLRRQAEGRNVRFITDADDTTVLHEYRSNLVTVLPSVKRHSSGYYEVPNVLGLTLLESMACGTPVVCTNVGPEPELVEDGKTGYVVPPNDSKTLGDRLNQLLSDPALASRMGLESRRRVSEMFTWTAVSERCLAAYQGGLA